MTRLRPHAVPRPCGRLHCHASWLLGLVLLSLGSAGYAQPMQTFATGAPLASRVFKTVGSHPLRLFYAIPADLPAGERRPAVVWIHGGGWTGGTLDGFMPHARYTAARGAIGFNIEYRLQTPDGTGVDTCIADCKSALRFIRAHAAEFGVDPRRIAVAGDSAGGHLAAALGTLEGFDDPTDDLGISARPDAMLLYNPLVDLTEGDWIRNAVGGTALGDRRSPRPSSAEAVARARSLSPLFNVRPGQPPALLMHGLADVAVPPAQAQHFADAARAAGNRCDLILLPDTPHAFIVAFWKSPERVVVDALREGDRFLASLGYLVGEPTLTVSDPPAWQPRGSAPVVPPPSAGR